MVAQGKYHYEILDKGNIIILAKKNKLTTSILYSINGGDEFKELQISDAEVEILGLTV